MDGLTSDNLTSGVHSGSAMNETREICFASVRWYLVGFLPLDVIGIVINLVVLLASLADKKKLQRQNYLFACVNSALLSHVVYLSLKIWSSAATTGAKDAPTMLGDPKTVWTVCEASTSAIGFGVVANATSLIYSVLDSTYVASRAAKTNENADVVKNSSKVAFKKKVSLLLIMTSWLVPLIFIPVATLVWNCSKDCRCPSSSFLGENCPHENGCSRLVKPMKTSYLLLQMVLWSMEIAGLIAMVAMKLRAFRATLAPSAESSTAATTEENKSPPTSAENGPSKNFPYRKCLTMNPRFRFAILLSVLLVSCFFPFAVAILIDAVSSSANLLPANIITDTSLYLYMIVCPLLVVKYLPSLKSSLISLPHKICNRLC